jgi:ubiquinone/menaquinone biosynthesis C-methylase UbiE
MRFMMFAIVIEDWPEAINELIRVCKPGGWIEIMERDILWYNETELVHNWRTTSKLIFIF